MHKRSIIWELSREKLIELVTKHNSLNDILLELGFTPASGGGYKTLSERLKLENIDTTDLLERSKKLRAEKSSGNNRTPFDIFFSKGRYRCTKSLKKYLLEKGLIENKCSKCNRNAEWEGLPLSLQLDHINGDNTDNRVSNLRMLCPNCHSQTETFGGGIRKFDRTKRKVSKEVLEHLLKENTLEETARITRTSNITVSKLIKFYGIEYVKKTARPKPLKFEIDAVRLAKLVETNSMEDVGKMFGVSSNSIRSRCRKLGVDFPKGRVGGYWKKNKIT